MRQGELINLKWQSILFDQGLIVLDNSYFLNKSRKIRTIPMNQIVTRILIQRKRANESSNVFTYKGEAIKQDFIIHKFKKFIRKAGLNDALNFHSLRHTYASWLVQKGASIYQVSKLLGHADVKTTQIYAHLATKDLSKVVNLLDED